MTRSIREDVSKARYEEIRKSRAWLKYGLACREENNDDKNNLINSTTLKATFYWRFTPAQPFLSERALLPYVHLFLYVRVATSNKHPGIRTEIEALNSRMHLWPHTGMDATLCDQHTYDICCLWSVLSRPNQECCGPPRSRGFGLTDKSCSRFLVCEMAVDWTTLAKHEWMGLVKGQAAPQWLQTRGISMKRPRAGRGTVYGI